MDSRRQISRSKTVNCKAARVGNLQMKIPYKLLFFSVSLSLLSLSPAAQKKGEAWSELDARGTALFSEQNYEESLAVFLAAVDAAKKEFGVDHGNYAGTLKSVGILYYYLSEAEESEKYFKEALATYERTTGKFTADYEDTLHGLTYLYQATGEGDKLLAVSEAQLMVSGKIHGAGSDEQLALQKQLSNLYMDRKEFVKAEAILLEGRAHSNSSPDLHGDFCLLLFQLYAEQDKPEKAEPYFQEAKLIRNKSQQELWKTIDFKSMTYSYEIDNQEERLAYWEEQAATLKASDPESVQYASTLINLATVYQTQEDLTKVEPLLMEAKAIIEADGSDTYLGTISGSLGYFYDMMGNDELSSKYYFEGLAFTRKAGGREDINYGTACHNVSMNRWKHGDLRACELYEKIALLIYANQQGGYGYYASAASGLAQVYEMQNNYTKAEAYQMEAVKIFEMAFGDNHYSYAAMAAGLARIYEKQKKVVEAEALLIKCKDIQEKTFGKDHAQYAGYCHELGQFYVRQRQYQKATPLLREAITIKLNRVQNNFGHLSETEKKDLYRYGKYYIDNYAYCLVKAFPLDVTAGEDLYDLMMSTKGLIFQSTAKARARILASGNDELINSFRDWTSRRDYLAKVYAMSLDQRVKQGIDVKSLEAEINASEKQLMQQAAKLDVAGFEDKGNIKWKQLKSRLKPGEAAVEIVRTTATGTQNEVIYAAVIITGREGSKPDVVILPGGSDLETRDIRYYNNAIQSRLDDTVSYRKYWEAIAAKLHGARRVYFSPAGVYHQLSLATLKNGASGKFLADEQEVIIVGNTGDLLSTQRKRRNSPTTYLMGYPDYKGEGSVRPGDPGHDGQRSADMTLATQRYFNKETGAVTPLPGTLKEVETIQALLKLRNVPVSVFTGAVASEEQLKKISNPGVLHIATHGFFLPNQHVSETETLAGKKLQDPLLRSGLLLADCEASLKGAAGSSEGEDGILTAYEAMNLFLDQTDMVILSACETGVGEIDNGEGVYGLQRAFQQAGSRYVLVSLWKVDDEATGLLMTKFYEMQLDGVPFAEAFDKARLAVREKYPEPYYWGAFVLIGS
jgi:CHAT domain-containing protein/tetratricopeptide (TPR) repeat protein